MGSIGNNAILIHGTCDREEYYDDSFPSLSNSHWFPWIQKQLLIRNIPTQTPEIPNAFSPNYDLWKKELERYEVNSNTILVGHSCGAGFLLRWVSELNIDLKKLILVAPWLDPNRSKTKDFFEFEINKTIPDKIETHLFYSKDDDEDILLSVERIAKIMSGIKIHEFSNFGHFTLNDMKTEKFVELLEVILSKPEAI